MKWQGLIQMVAMVAVVLGGVTAGAAPAVAKDITVEVRSIAASREGDSVDPKLKDIQGTLNVTFAGYSNFEQLGVQRVGLAPRKSKKVKLPNGSMLTLTFQGLAGDLIKLGLGIADKMNTTLRVSPGSTFFQAGMRYKGGILILAIKVL